MATQGFYTSSTIRRHALLRAFPAMNGSGVTNNSSPNGKSKTHSFELNVEKRFSRGFNLNFGYSALAARDSFYLNEFDPAPSWRLSNNGRPQRVTGTAVFEFPFGNGKRFGSSWSRPLDLILGGWQTAWTYEYQPGPLLDWGNVFYYGNDLSDILKVERTWDKWFNTANFETNSSRTAAAFHRRVFPTRVPDLRRDKTSQWNGNLAKNVRIRERANLQLRLNALNVQNRSQMNAPSTDPTSTNFGRITSQSAATNRWIDVQARITF
jgi:hypothetical protein